MGLTLQPSLFEQSCPAYESLPQLFNGCLAFFQEEYNQRKELNRQRKLCLRNDNDIFTPAQPEYMATNKSSVCSRLDAGERRSYVQLSPYVKMQHKTAVHDACGQPVHWLEAVDSVVFNKPQQVSVHGSLRSCCEREPDFQTHRVAECSPTYQQHECGTGSLELRKGAQTSRRQV